MKKSKCKNCKKEFKYHYYYKNKKKRKFCGRKCYHNSTKGKPTWNKNIHIFFGDINKIFKKGRKAWNKNKRCRYIEGKRNPAKRLEVRKKIKKNHWATDRKKEISNKIWKTRKIRFGKSGGNKGSINQKRCISKIMKENNPMKKEKNRKRMRENNPSKYCNNPSKPQQYLYEKIKKLFYFTNVYLNYKVSKKDKGYYYLDVAVPLFKLNIEYDNIFWHKFKKNDDKIRDNYLKSIGWNIIRITDG